MNFNRLNKLLMLMKKFGLAGLALNPGPTLTYLSGLQFHLMERPTVLLITQDGRAAMVLPELEKGKLGDETSLIRAFTYGDDPSLWPLAFEKAGAWLNLKGLDVGLEPTRLRFLELSYLEGALGEINFIDASQEIAALRMVKEDVEIEKMSHAVRIAEEALLATLKICHEGITEKTIANELVIQLLKAGSAPQLPFMPIVAIGENSADPHSVPTDRALKRGDVLLIDWGACFEGYLSDITRTFTFGNVDPELLAVGDIVLKANQAGRSAGAPGVRAGAVDLAARSVIAEAGYGEAFIHRTGHGLGLEAHEAPYIFGENDLVLEPGMTFTVEPGIYLPGKGGIRIEDDVVMTADGLVSLTAFPRSVAPLEDFIN